MVWLSLFGLLLQGCESANPFDQAVKCANDFLAQNNKIPDDWMPNGTFGGGFTAHYVGHVSPGRTSLPPVNMFDGPQGLRDILDGILYEPRTSWPAAASYGQSWSPELAFFSGVLGARDWRAVKANVALTPGVNVHRVPTNGRNWEYISGEAAHLGEIGGALVAGIQKDGMMGSLKHFALNSQELNRTAVISEIDEETLMTTYLPAFQPAIDSGVGSVMCSYNQIRFTDDLDSYAHTCGSKRLSSHLLRDVMGFKATIMTDWGAFMDNTTNGKTFVDRSVLDWEMAGEGVQVPSDVRADLAEHSLVGLFASGVGPKTNISSCANAKTPTSIPSISKLPNIYQEAIQSNSAKGVAVAVIAESMVLLKNQDQILPLKKTTKNTRLAPWSGKDCVGDNLASKSAESFIECPYFCSKTPNCTAYTFFQKTCYSKAYCAEFVPKDGCTSGSLYGSSILLTGTALLNGGGSGDSAAFGWQEPQHEGEGVNTGGAYALSYMVRTLSSHLGAFVVYGNDPTGFDTVIAFGGQFRSEAYLVDNQDGHYQIDHCDYTNYTKSGGTYGLCNFPVFIKNLAKATKPTPTKQANSSNSANTGKKSKLSELSKLSKVSGHRAEGEELSATKRRLFRSKSKGQTKLIAVITAGGVHLPNEYIDDVDAAISLFYPGQHFADALALVLSGEVSPGGKLTHTLPSLEDDGVHIQSPIGRFDKGLQYETGGRNTLSNPSYFWDPSSSQRTDIVQYGSDVSTYEEGRLVGYKYYEYYKMTPAFEFGYGLSFAKFDVQVDFGQCTSTDSCSISINTKQKGFAGAASTVVQIYVGFTPTEAVASHATCCAYLPDPKTCGKCTQWQTTPYCNQNEQQCTGCNGRWCPSSPPSPGPPTPGPSPVRPVKELKGFRKVWGTASEQIDLASKVFALDWNRANQQYVYPCTTQAGTFTVYAGTSSKDIISSTQLPCKH